jgi:uncharacterized membrane protein
VTVGPVEIVVLGFEGPVEFDEITAELERLRDGDVVRLVDVIAVQKTEHGVIETIQRSDLAEDEAVAFGAAIGALIGLGAGGESAVEAGAVWGARELADRHLFDEEDSWAIAERIPEGSAAVVALVEHRWRIPVRDAVRRAGGRPLAAGWLREEDLVALGRLVGGLPGLEAGQP